MPAEWSRHEATWLVWPHRPDDWPGRFGPVPFAFGEIVRHLAPHEQVRIVVQSERVESQARSVLTSVGVELDAVRFFRWPTDRSWTRDSGPIFVRRPEQGGNGPSVAITDWKFNGWAKYDDRHRDDRLPGRIARQFEQMAWRPRVDRRPFVLEGGAIDTNGDGSLLATEECLLSDVQARNPGIDRASVERVLSEYLGIDRVLWLARGIVGDDTHGHIDDVARFVGPRTIVAGREPDPNDVNFPILEENLARLRETRDAAGQPFEIVELPMPRALAYDGQRVPASYLNFYIANRTVLVPTFNDPADRRAIAALEPHFPGREVVGIHSGDLIWGLGSIHCLTQQEPSAVA
jgi:agmatine deiminase